MRSRMSLTAHMRIIGFLVIMATLVLSSATCDETTNQSSAENGDSVGDASQFAIYLVTDTILVRASDQVIHESM